jgi:hypothetical protein
MAVGVVITGRVGPVSRRRVQTAREAIRVEGARPEDVRSERLAVVAGQAELVHFVAKEVRERTARTEGNERERRAAVVVRLAVVRHVAVTTDEAGAGVIVTGTGRGRERQQATCH